MKKEMIILRLFSVALFGCLLAACGAGKWKGETYSGNATVDGAELHLGSVKEFKLTTSPGTNQKNIVLDEANKTLGGCTIPLNDSSERKEGLFYMVENGNAVCVSVIEGKPLKFEIRSGSVTPNQDANQNDVKVQAWGGYPGDFKIYNFEIYAKRRD